MSIQEPKPNGLSWAPTFDCTARSCRNNRKSRSAYGSAFGTHVSRVRLLNSPWGVVRQRASWLAGSAELLDLVRYDTAHDRGIYRVMDAVPVTVDEPASRRRLQLSAR